MRQLNQQVQQRVFVGNGCNSFLIARWRPPQAAVCRSCPAVEAADATRCALLRRPRLQRLLLLLPPPPLLLRPLLVLLYSQFGKNDYK